MLPISCHFFVSATFSPLKPRIVAYCDNLYLLRFGVGQMWKPAFGNALPGLFGLKKVLGY